MASPDATWFNFTCSVRGARHVASDAPNQDATAVVPASTLTSDRLVLAISDGHGSSAYRRSDVGAQLAVQTVCEIGQQFLDQAMTESLQALKPLAEEWVPREIVRAWRAAVDRHLTQTDVEVQEGCEESDPRMWYGATVLGAVLTPEVLVFWQLGDGDVVLVSSDGRVKTPLAPERPQLGVETDSLLNKGAWRDMRVHWLPLVSDPPPLVLLTTDGLANSFESNEAFLAFGPDMLKRLEAHGLDEVREQLPQWLTKASEFSGDDVSVVGAWRKGP